MLGVAVIHYYAKMTLVYTDVDLKLQDPKGQIQKKAYKVLSVILKVLLPLP